MSFRSLTIIALGVYLISVGGCHIAQQSAIGPPTVVFDRSVHFRAPDGTNIVVEPGNYYLTTEPPILKLSGVERQGVVMIQGDLTDHSEYLINPVAIFKARKRILMFIGWNFSSPAETLSWR